MSTHLGRLAASKATQPFVKDVTELLRETIYDKSVFLLPSAYPMANKLVWSYTFAHLTVLLNFQLLLCSKSYPSFDCCMF